MDHLEVNMNMHILHMMIFNFMYIQRYANQWFQKGIMDIFDISFTLKANIQRRHIIISSGEAREWLGSSAHLRNFWASLRKSFKQCILLTNRGCGCECQCWCAASHDTDNQPHLYPHSPNIYTSTPTPTFLEVLTRLDLIRAESSSRVFDSKTFRFLSSFISQRESIFKRTNREAER